jgi:hypothetical protein
VTLDIETSIKFNFKDLVAVVLPENKNVKNWRIDVEIQLG